MRPPEQFATRRLTARPVRITDAAALFEAYAGDPVATRYLSFRTHETVSETRDFLADAEASWRDGSEYVWALTPRDAPRPIGALGATVTPHGIEIGYVLARDHWGHGLMTEAVGTLIAALSEQPDIYRVWAYCAVDHVRSIHVLERSGMTYEATLRRWVVLPNLADEPCDVRVYSWIRQERRADDTGLDRGDERREPHDGDQRPAVT